MKHSLWILFFLLTSPITWAQTSDNIISGRPGQSIGSEVVGTKILQIQSGLEHSAGDAKSWINDHVIRFGLNDLFEISSAFSYRFKDNHGTGLDNLELGGRVKLIEEAKGLIPSLALQIRMRLKGEGDFKREEARPVTILTSVHDMKEWGSLNLNLTHSYSASGGEGLYGYIVNWSISLNDKWSVFIEEYAQYNVQWNHAWDTGAAYLVNKDMQLDFSFGFDLESAYSSSFTSLGISWRTSLI